MKNVLSLKIFTGILLLIIPFLAITIFQELTAKEVVEKADKNMRGDTSLAKMTIKIVRPTWDREMDMITWSKGEDYAMVLVTSPAREKGTAFLKRKKEVWNWVPSIERNIKLPPSMMSQSWMGTDFTNDDLVREASSVSDYNHKHLGMDTISGKECYKIEMIPKPSAAIVWEKVIVWIDAKDFLQLKAEFYDEDGELINILNSSEVKEMGGRKVTSKLEMIPVDKEGYRTVIIYKDIVYNKEIKDDFFTTRNMKHLK
jgi:outer membrane lipoprotein-sorting protein